jgi:large subunit ribosomal protein L10
MEGAALDADQLRAIARLPSREVLYGQLAGVVASPITGLVRTLGALVGGLAVALGQVREKLESGEIPAGAPPAPEAEASAEEAPATEAPAAEAEPAIDTQTEPAQPVTNDNQADASAETADANPKED